MNHEYTFRYGLEIRQFSDPESESGMCWIVDVMNGNECVIEGAGVSSTLMAAMQEAGKELTHEIASYELERRLNA